MQVFCTKCNAGYTIAADLIPEKGRKLRCANCNEVFICKREDTQEEIIEDLNDIVIDTPNTSENPIINQHDATTIESEANVTTDSETKTDDEMEEVFKRLSMQTQNLFEIEKDLKPHTKIYTQLKNNLGLNTKLNKFILIFIIAFIILLSLLSYKYEVVRAVPFMNSVYSIFNIDAKIPGEGLEFQNVSRTEYEDDFVKKLEVNGFIFNKTNKTLDIPLVKINMLDKDTRNIQTLNKATKSRSVNANAMIPFKFIITKPSSLTKYIQLIFTKEKNNK